MGRPDSPALITQQPLPHDTLVAGSQLDSYRTQQNEGYRSQHYSNSSDDRPCTPTMPEQVLFFCCWKKSLIEILIMFQNVY